MVVTSYYNLNNRNLELLRTKKSNASDALTKNHPKISLRKNYVPFSKMNNFKKFLGRVAKTSCSDLPNLYCTINH